MDSLVWKKCSPHFALVDLRFVSLKARTLFALAFDRSEDAQSERNTGLNLCQAGIGKLGGRRPNLRLDVGSHGVD